MEQGREKRRLVAGEELRLDAVYVEERKRVGFMPVFIADDLLVIDHIPGAVYMGSRRKSVRIFLPANRCDLKDGEEWEAQITEIKVTEKLTRDYRYKIYINVEVLRRVERSTISFNLGRGLWIEKTISGRVVVRLIETPAERKVHNYFFGGEVFVVEEIISKSGNILQRKLLEKSPTEEFVRMWCKSFNVPRIDPGKLIAAVRKFPAPPPEIMQ